MKIYHGYKPKDLHTVIPGIIQSVTDEGTTYYVTYIKRIRNRVTVSSDFDDMGKRKQSELYHYNQKSNKGEL